MNFFIKIFFIIVLNISLFGDIVANITALRGHVFIENGQLKKEATLGAKLYENDNIITLQKSKAQIIFKDETIVTIGKNSNFSIKKYIYDNENSEVELNILKGAMRTITGKIGKIAPNRFKVHTKTATIGIRGTNFTILASQNGEQRVYCTYGAVTVTLQDTTKLVEQGFYVTIEPQKGIGNIEKFSQQDLKVVSENAFGVTSNVKDKLDKNEKNIDLITNIVSQVMIDKVEEAVENSIDTEDNDVDSKEDIIDDVEEEIIEEDDEIISIEQTILAGYIIDTNVYFDISSNIFLTISEDGGFGTDEYGSWIEIYNKENINGELDDWKFYIQDKANEFKSYQSFSTALSGVEVYPINGSSSHDAKILNSNISTFDSISPDNHMSWGEWNVDVSYKYNDNLVEEEVEDSFFGLWIAGEVTDDEVVNALDGIYSYNGAYKVVDIRDSSNIETGNTILLVDFGNNLAGMEIFKNNSLVKDNYHFINMQIVNSGLIGGEIIQDEDSLPLEGSVSGSFYGEDGMAVGGSFEINGENLNLKGIYQAISSGKNLQE